VTAAPAPATSERRLGPVLLVAGAAVIVLTAMSVASYLVAVLLLSLLVALLLAPLRSRLIGRGLGGGLALLLCLAAYGRDRLQRDRGCVPAARGGPCRQARPVGLRWGQQG